jgi:hypothetical protein
MATTDDALVDHGVDGGTGVDPARQGVDQQAVPAGQALPDAEAEPDEWRATTPRLGRPFGAIVAIVVAGVLLLFGTTALVKILNPKLASMPPIMRKPAEVAPPTPEPPALPAIASSRPSPSPSRSRRPDPPPPTTRPAPPATSAAAPPLLISMEAESAERSSRPRVRSVNGASGGQVLGRIGEFDEFVRFSRVRVSTGGRYTLTIFYIATQSRGMTLRVNGNGRAPIVFGSTGSSDTVGSRQVNVTLAAGENTLQLDNINGSFGPEIDRITVTR